MTSSDFSDVFISYRRTDVDFTKHLVQSLKDAGKEVWIDWEDIPPGSTGFSDDIKRGLEGSDAFICILTPAYLESTYCIDLELGYALKLNKKIIPIILEKFPDGDTPHGIAHINWIYAIAHAGQTNTLDEVVARVITALDVDVNHGRAHKRILLRALSWDNNARENSFLLTGAEIIDAESWLANASNKEPEPLDLHRDYVVASRAQATRRQQQILAGVSVALVVSLALSILSFLLYGQAEASRTIADDNASTAIAAQATAQQQADESYALASALRAIDTLNTDPFLAYALVIDALQSMPRIDTFIQRTARNILLNTGAILSLSPDRDGMDIFSIDNIGRLALVSQADSRDDIIPNQNIWVYDFVEQAPVHDLNIVNEGLFQGAIQNGIVVFPDFDLATATEDALSESTLSFQRVGEAEPFWQLSLISSGYAEDPILDTLVLSPDGTHVALYYMDNADVTHHVLVMNIMTQTEVFWMQFNDTIGDFAFSDDNRLLALSEFSTVFIYDLTSGERISDPINFTFSSRIISALDISEDNTLLAIGGLVPSIIIWDIAQNQAVANLSGHDDLVTSVKFDASGTFLLTGASDRKLILWDVTRQQQLATYPYHEDTIVSVGTYPNGLDNIFYSMTINGVYTQWEAQTDSASIRLSEFGGNGISFDDTGNNVLYYSFDYESDSHQFVSHDLATGEVTPRFSVPIDFVDNPLIFVPYQNNTRAIFTELYELEGVYSLPQVIDLTTSEPIASLETNGWAETVIVNDNGTRALFLNTHRLDVELWDLTTYEQLQVYDDVYAVAFYPDSDHFLMSGMSEGNNVIMTEFDDGGDPVRDIIVNANDIFIIAIDIHPNSNQALIATIANTLYQIDLREGIEDRIMSQYEAHTATVTLLDYSHDGSLFFSTAQDDRAILWDVGTGQILRTFEVGVSVNSAQFAPQDAMLAVSSATDQLILWRLYEDNDLIAWAYDNLQVPLINCEQRINLKIAPQCNDDRAIPATPTLAPTKVVSVTTIVPSYSTAMPDNPNLDNSDIDESEVAGAEGIDADNYTIDGIELYTETENALVDIFEAVLGTNTETMSFDTLDIWEIDLATSTLNQAVVTIDAASLADHTDGDYVLLAMDVIGGGEIIYSEFIDTDTLDNGVLQLTWQAETELAELEILYVVVSGSMDNESATYSYTLVLE